MILVIDNYDSFVHNLARYVTLAGAETRIERNDALSIKGIEAIAPSGIILSPGPCTPNEAGICTDIVTHFGASTPILGVCLGHQCIGQAYGAQTVCAVEPMHGKDCELTHNGKGVFTNLPSPMRAARYHSLITALADDGPLHATAHAEDGTVMAIAHKTHPVTGVQFHPESVLTEHGMGLIQNFVNITQNYRKVA